MLEPDSYSDSLRVSRICYCPEHLLYHGFTSRELSKQFKTINKYIKVTMHSIVNRSSYKTIRIVSISMYWSIDWSDWLVIGELPICSDMLCTHLARWFDIIHFNPLRRGDLFINLELIKYGWLSQNNDPIAICLRLTDRYQYTWEMSTILENWLKSRSECFRLWNEFEGIFPFLCIIVFDVAASCTAYEISRWESTEYLSFKIRFIIISKSIIMFSYSFPRHFYKWFNSEKCILCEKTLMRRR